MGTASTPPLCPSAPPEWPGSIAIGIVGGTADAPRMAHLASALPTTPELLALAAPVTPTEVFRFAAPCVCDGCVHFQDANCRLVTRVVKLLPQATEKLAACAIRAHCRWWLQEGKAACLRCPQIVTTNFNPSLRMREAAGPNTCSG